MITVDYVMLLIRKFKKEDVLKIVAEYASRSLPEHKKGMIESREAKNGGIEVYFIEDESRQDQAVN